MTALEQLFSLKGKKAIVTGGAQGIGKIVAARMAEVGADVAIFDTQLKEAEAAAKEIAILTGRKVLGYQINVKDPAQMNERIQKAAEDFRGMDLLFNSTGTEEDEAPAETVSEKPAYDSDKNPDREYYMASEFAHYLKKNGRKGSIVNLASVSGPDTDETKKEAPCSVSREDIIRMTKSLAAEYREDGIRVNSLSPGYMYTEPSEKLFKERQETRMYRTPAGRYGKPEELCGAVIYLFSDSASFTTGTDLIVDGGYAGI